MFWARIRFEERNSLRCNTMRNYYSNLNNKEFFELRKRLLQQPGFEEWQRMIRQIFGLSLPPRVQELISSVYFAK